MSREGELPRLTVDHDADMAYVRVREGPRAHSVSLDMHFLSIDFDADDGIVGYTIRGLNPTPAMVDEARKRQTDEMARSIAETMRNTMEAFRRMRDDEPD